MVYVFSKSIFRQKKVIFLFLGRQGLVISYTYRIWIIKISKRRSNLCSRQMESFKFQLLFYRNIFPTVPLETKFE